MGFQDIDDRTNSGPQGVLSKRSFSNRTPLLASKQEPPAPAIPMPEAPMPPMPEAPMPIIQKDKGALPLPKDMDELAVLAFQKAMAAISGNTADVDTLKGDVRSLKYSGEYPLNHIPTIEDLVSTSSENTCYVRGTKERYKVPVLHAYLISDDTLVSPAIPYNDSTMYLYPTWDWVRQR